ncbi:MAG TPA: hypothetical protein DEZ08_06535 [Dehalococcoidia bacterium]|jgi:DNA-binding response OmpR family regulator|nr:hypothetical protein [Dehalococcoidia bacterium]
MENYPRNAVLIYCKYDDTLGEAQSVLEKTGYIVSVACTFDGAMDLIRSTDFHYVLIDESVESVDQKYLVSESRRCNPDAAVILFNAVESILTRFRHARS